MSFSYADRGPADEVRKRLKAIPADAPHVLPHSLKEFLLLAIHATKVAKGGDCWVAVSASGHVGEVTNTSIAVGQTDADEPANDQNDNPEPVPAPTGGAPNTNPVAQPPGTGQTS